MHLFEFFMLKKKKKNEGYVGQEIRKKKKILQFWEKAKDNKKRGD